MERERGSDYGINGEEQMSTENKPSGFTLPMALMDMLPVLFFSVSVGVLSLRFDSVLFLIGAVLVILAGAMKVFWKLLLAIVKKDVRIFNRQMRFLMPTGFILTITGLIVDHEAWSLQAIAAHIFSFPSIIFFILALAGIVCMIYFARHFDQMDAKSNWIEQGTNALTQFLFMMGILV